MCTCVECPVYRYFQVSNFTININLTANEIENVSYTTRQYSDKKISLTKMFEHFC